MGMDFSSFIRPYMQTVYLLDKAEGEWVGGIWVPGEEEEKPFQAAIMPLNDDLLAFGEAGTYTEHDKRIFTYHKLNQGQKIRVSEELYTITAEKDYSYYAEGLRVYIARREGAASD